MPSIRLSMNMLKNNKKATDLEFELAIKEIIHSISEAGYEPYSQLYGYLSTGKDVYITRNGNAREKIKDLSWLDLKNYVEQMKDGKTSGT